jgi:hypothetical protein
MKNNQIDNVIEILTNSWSIHTSSKWTNKNPANGQCGVTSLVINDLYGGDILRTQTTEGWHFYNRIDGQRYDLTETQFKEKPQYQDIESSREEAFGDTNEDQYVNLKSKVYKALRSIGRLHKPERVPEFRNIIRNPLKQ